MIGDSVGFFKEQGREVIYDAELDGYKANPPMLKTLRQHLKQEGLIVLFDTTAVLLPRRLSRC